MAMLTIPANQNGMVLDPSLNAVVATAIAADPFGFEDVFVYSHGWSTNADQALINYDVFSIGMMRRLLQAQAEGPLPRPPRPALEVGIHWPSEITEDPGSPLDDLQLFTFYTMEHRADAVGKNLVYSVLRMALQAKGARGLRFFLLGHSFGCKVVCSALQDVYADIQNGTIALDAQTEWRIVLLEPATDWDNLEEADVYGNVGKFANLRLLATMSKLDRALTEWYPAASRIANLFHGANPIPAVGAVGPSPATVTYFGGVSNVAVPIGFAIGDALKLQGKLVVADLTPAHQSRVSAGLYDGGFSGSHSDVYFDEVYNLVSGFIYA
jgi:hypothetical protein